MTMDPIQLGQAAGALLAGAAISCATVWKLLRAWAAREEAEHTKRREELLAADAQRREEMLTTERKERARSRRALRGAIRSEMRGFTTRLERLEHAFEEFVTGRPRRAPPTTPAARRARTTTRSTKT